MTDQIALQEQYNSFHSDGSLERYDEEARAFVRDMARVAAKQRAWATSFLDVGCRVGYALDEMQQLFPEAKVTGVDLVPKFVSLSEGYCEDVHIADACALPFEDESYDWVFCSQVLEHTTDVPKAISELCRVSRYGLYISIPLEDDNEESRVQNPSHNYFEPNPIAWLSLWLKHPNWVLLKCSHPQRGCFNFVLINREKFKVK